MVAQLPDYGFVCNVDGICLLGLKDYLREYFDADLRIHLRGLPDAL
jgi:hypothetical protein